MAMTAKDVIELGKACGLETVGEAVRCVLMHPYASFNIENIEQQETDMFRDLERHGLQPEMKIKDVNLTSDKE